MAKQTQASFPLTLLAIGDHGPFTSGLLPPAFTGYVVDLLNDASWPASGDVCTITIEQSNDSGQTWAFDASVTLAGGVWKNRQGVTVNAAPWSVSINNAGSTTRKVRATVAAIQACTLGATTSSV